jgi:hypothetical protein
MDAKDQKNKDQKKKSYSTKKTEKNEKSGPGDKPGRSNILKSDLKK